MTKTDNQSSNDKLNTTNLALIQQNLLYIQKDIVDIKFDLKDVKNLYVTREKLDDELQSIRSDIEPLRRLVYGVLTIIATSVVGAIATFFITRHQ